MTAEVLSSTTISRLRVPEIDELPAALRDQISSLTAQLGYTPNWVRAFALGGAHAARFNAYLLALLDPNGGLLPYVDREILATVTSAENGCSYCRLNHAGSLGEALGDKRIGTRVAIDYREVRELSARHRTLAGFASRLALHPTDVTDADIEGLRELGLDDEQIYEAIQVVAAFVAANRFSIVLQVTPDDQFFG
ncbi:peroxidase-related enzyme [Pseudonocardia endophytica]|uniref:Putative peroxidase-related enzyme n=1 Tax=Pseudonocardia endophytica TaxID=401976 RepID=A0A4R1HIH7_PSEEN|nr:peroxidase-related enzyme [Pseudonocardia endophytica]TCK22057.1 putative peroxidase-related enzyme [Pseudonocardia endophytica]